MHPPQVIHASLSIRVYQGISRCWWQGVPCRCCRWRQLHGTPAPPASHARLPPHDAPHKSASYPNPRSTRPRSWMAHLTGAPRTQIHGKPGPDPSRHIPQERLVPKSKASGPLTSVVNRVRASLSRLGTCLWRSCCFEERPRQERRGRRCGTHTPTHTAQAQGRLGHPDARYFPCARSRSRLS